MIINCIVQLLLYPDPPECIVQELVLWVVGNEDD